MVWELTQEIELEFGPVDFVIRIMKKAKSPSITQDWDTYWIRLTLDGVVNDDDIEYRQTKQDDYTAYSPNEAGVKWVFNPPDLLRSEISATLAYPIAWDRDEPGPPFVPAV